MAAEALEQSMLESKDKEQLLAIAQALGIKTTSRAAKATLIDKILETTGGGAPASQPTASATNGRAPKARREAVPAAPIATAVAEVSTDTPEPVAAVTTADAPVEAEVILGFMPMKCSMRITKQHPTLL